MKKQRLQMGAIVEIRLDDDHSAYGRVVSKSELVFYDLRAKSDKQPTVAEIVNAKVAFRIWVMNHAVKSGRWPIVEVVPLEPALLTPPPYFMQDAFTNEFSLYIDGDIRPATRKECMGLECAAAWDPEHVEDRLRDHFAGKPNVWVEQLQPR